MFVMRSSGWTNLKGRTRLSSSPIHTAWRIIGGQQLTHNQRVRRTTPNLSKGPLLATKWTENGVLVGGLGGEVQKVHFLGQRSIFGRPAPPQIRSWIRAWGTDFSFKTVSLSCFFFSWGWRWDKPKGTVGEYSL